MIKKTEYINWAEKMHQKEFEEKFNEWLKSGKVQQKGDSRYRDDFFSVSYVADVFNSRTKKRERVEVVIEYIKGAWFKKKNGMLEEAEKRGWNNYGFYTGIFSLERANRLSI